MGICQTGYRCQNTDDHFSYLGKSFEKSGRAFQELQGSITRSTWKIKTPSDSGKRFELRELQKRILITLENKPTSFTEELSMFKEEFREIQKNISGTSGKNYKIYEEDNNSERFRPAFRELQSCEKYKDEFRKLQNSVLKTLGVISENFKQDFTELWIEIQRIYGKLSESFKEAFRPLQGRTLETSRTIYFRAGF